MFYKYKNLNMFQKCYDTKNAIFIRKYSTILRIQWKL